MRRVVVGIDATKASGLTLEAAGNEARVRDGVLQVVTVWPHPAMTPGQRWADAVDRLAADTTDQCNQQVDQTFGSAADRDVEVEVTVTSGSPAKGVLEAATAADLLVIGRRDKTRLQQFWLGSVADQCVRHSPCPIMVVPAASEWEGPRDGPIVVGIDGSDQSLAALEWAIEQAHLRRCEVHAVYCWAEHPHALATDAGVLGDAGDLEAEASSQLDAWIETAKPPTPSAVLPYLRRGEPARTLLDEAEGAAMVVVGSRGRGGFARLLLGSVSRDLVSQAAIPVVVIA